MGPKFLERFLNLTLPGNPQVFPLLLLLLPPKRGSNKSTFFSDGSVEGVTGAQSRRKIANARMSSVSRAALLQVDSPMAQILLVDWSSTWLLIAEAVAIVRNF